MTKDGTRVARPQLSRAAEQFRESIKINPKNYKSHYQLGILLSKQQQYIEAFQSLSLSIKINPNFANGHYQLAVLLMNDHAQSALRKTKHIKAPTKVTPKSKVK